jgi:hypothetical protein
MFEFDTEEWEDYAHDGVEIRKTISYFCLVSDPYTKTIYWDKQKLGLREFLNSDLTDEKLRLLIRERAERKLEESFNSFIRRDEYEKVDKKLIEKADEKLVGEYHEEWVDDEETRRMVRVLAIAPMPVVVAGVIEA